MLNRVVVLLLASCFFVGCAQEEEDFTVVEVLEVECREDVECETPNDYLIRSICPYTSKCIEGQCAVVCPEPFLTN